MARTRYTKRQWINILAAIPAIVSLCMAAGSILITVMFWVATSSYIGVIVGAFLLMCVGAVFMRASMS